METGHTILPGGDDVSLDDLHHGRLQLEFALATGAHPGMPVHVFQLFKFKLLARVS